MKLLFTVSDRFKMEGRGCVLVPGLPTEAGSPNLPRGTRIRLRTPAGQETDTVIKELLMVSHRKALAETGIPILLPKDVLKRNVPAGTEVLLMDE